MSVRLCRSLVAAALVLGAVATTAPASAQTTVGVDGCGAFARTGSPGQCYIVATGGFYVLRVFATGSGYTDAYVDCQPSGVWRAHTEYGPFGEGGVRTYLPSGVCTLSVAAAVEGSARISKE